MNEREKLLKRVQMCDFVLKDTALYLDSHPDNKVALDYYKKHLKLRGEAAEAYTRKYGPLTHHEYDGGPRWNWVDGPWPWQNQEG